jgi:hypothetical protein
MIRLWRAVAALILFISTAGVAATKVLPSVDDPPVGAGQNPPPVDHTTAFDGIEKTLADPAWQIRRAAMNSMAIELAFGSLEKPDLDSLRGHVKFAFGFIMNDRKADTRGNLTLYVLDDAAFAQRFVELVEESFRLNAARWRSEYEYLKVVPVEGIAADLTRDIRFQWQGRDAQPWETRVVVVARQKFILVLTDLGLNIPYEKIIAAMEQSFENLGVAAEAQAPANERSNEPSRNVDEEPQPDSPSPP